VTDIINSDINDVDTLPIAPLKTITQNGRIDSIWMKREDVRQFAYPFLNPVIDSTHMKNLFVEKSFMDQTINALTFSYEPARRLPDSLELRSWNVYVDPEKNTVTRIYLVKEHKLPDGTIVIMHLTWNNGKSCEVTYITEKDKTSSIREEKVTWDFKE
jgi:hypothetical protein